MHRRITLSIAMAAIGVGLLVASSFAGAASAGSPQTAGSSEAKRGGTLRLNVSTTDFEFTDPAMAYDAIGWQMLYAVNVTLLNYPDKPAPEGTRLVPEAASGFPRVSRDGKTYTFTVRSGLKFSDGSPVTAAAFKRAIERAADPQQASPAIAFLHDVVGADARNLGKARSVTGVTANGQTLVIKLRQANPTFLAELAMPFFGAVKPSMAIDPKGISVYPSAGPYRIVSRTITQSLTLARNPNYKGSRPANADRIVYTVNTDQNQSLLQVRAGPGRLRRLGRAADRSRRPRAAVRRQEGRQRPLLRQPVHGRRLRGAEHVAGAVQPGEPPQGGELRDRPPGDGARLRQVLRQADGSDPAAEPAGLPRGDAVPDQGRRPGEGPPAERRRREHGHDHPLDHRARARRRLRCSSSTSSRWG